MHISVGNGPSLSNAASAADPPDLRLHRATADPYISIPSWALLIVQPSYASLTLVAIHH